MADVVWTDAQRQAIDAEDRTLLVSAAAGSGKTAVLTERILEKLRDPAGSADLNRMLIVTFTNEAAKELKGRIGQKLSDALALDPGNKRLAKQLAAVPGAKICTIDSFCIDLVKSNFELLGLPCGTKTGDPMEINLMQRKVMDALFDDLYADPETFRDFDKFTDVFIADRDDTLPELFLALYKRLCAYAEGVAVLRTFADNLHADRDLPFFTGRHGRFVKERTQAFLDCYQSRATRFAAYFAGDRTDKQSQNYFTAYSAITATLNALEQALDADDYPTAQRVLASYTRLRMSNSNLKDDPEGELIKGTRDSFDTEIVKLRDAFFRDTEEQIREQYDRNIELLHGIYRFLHIFEEKFAEEKRRRRVMDFADAERFALKLLCEDGQPSELAIAYGKRFDEIYIDEYQDTNELQDTIFRMLATSAHRYMVGDIKQSIYGFRGAEPSIFAGYRDSFPQYDPETPAQTGTIFLSNNFRCGKPIVDFCNHIFSALMNHTFGGVSYLPQDNLVYSKHEDVPITDPVEVVLLDKRKDNKTEIEEAEYVAARIEGLLKEGYRPEDIVILLRAPKLHAAPFQDALERIHIPCHTPLSAGFFENAEILLAMCLLNIIDNPRRDIQLAGALKSPVFGFTLDELASIRRQKRNGYLYDALCDWAKLNPSPKTEYFFSFLTEMREFARSAPIDKLIWHLYTETSLLSDIYGTEDANEDRRANLMMLYEYARSFEAGSFKGLYNFILYVQEIIDRGEQLAQAQTQGDSASAVRILSIHNSKGLEFKVCFLCHTNKSASSHASDDRLMLDPDLGIGTYTAEKTGLARVNNLLRRCVAAKLDAEDVAEEMRNLYVALTRAKERLIITAKSTHVPNLQGRCELLHAGLSPYATLGCHDLITMILTGMHGKESDPCWKLQILGADSTLQQGEVVENTVRQTDLPITPDYETCTRVIEERFAFRYPHSAASGLPSKLSVSRLYPAILDEEEVHPPSAPMRERPAFLAPQGTATAAEQGTATHVFMQFCDFDTVQSRGVDAEIERLITKQFLPESYRELIERDKLERFFAGELFARMKHADRIWRETRFNITLPATDFTEQEPLRAELADEQILVQGVIDCFFRDTDGKIWIVDYKTDHFSEAQRKNPEGCARVLRERHERQLQYYRIACEQLLGQAPDHTVIYSFDLGDTVEVSVEK